MELLDTGKSEEVHYREQRERGGNSEIQQQFWRDGEEVNENSEACSGRNHNPKRLENRGGGG